MVNDTEAEFIRQVNNLIDKGYPKLAGLSERMFRTKLMPLKTAVRKVKNAKPDLEKGTLPFVLVIKSDWIPSDKMMKKVERAGKKGVVAMQPCRPDQFSAIESISIPEGQAYIIAGIDRGRKSLNVRPEDAMKTIKKARRSPLTIDEGIALVTHVPDFLMKNNCYSLLASRRKDQRVPAIWINGARAPKLGWCWDRNPHTWLGSASCKDRLGTADAGT